MGPIVHQLLPPVMVFSGDSGLAGINAGVWGPAPTAVGHFPTFPSIPFPLCNSAAFGFQNEQLTCHWENSTLPSVLFVLLWHCYLSGDREIHTSILGVLRVPTGNKSQGGSSSGEQGCSYSSSMML